MIGVFVVSSLVLLLMLGWEILRALDRRWGEYRPKGRDYFAEEFAKHEARRKAAAKRKGWF